MLLYPEVGLCHNEVSQRNRDKLEAEAAERWDKFYRANDDKFYKDRHYFDREFPELLSGPLTVLEVGCGAGNTVFPLLELNPGLQVFACDFSPRAVSIVQAHPSYASTGRVSAFVADITKDDLTAHVPRGSVDCVTMVFVLSAISPARMHAALANVAAVLRPGTGRVLFRDYARGDLAQDRHQRSGVKRLAENFYVRGDGTRCFYFSEPELVDLFAAHGFRCCGVKLHERDVENHKRQITMHRRWVQAVFQLDAAAGVAGAGAVPAAAVAASGGGSSTGHDADLDSPQRSHRQLDAALPEECASVPGSWLVGAAGRLASGLITPGVPSGRAQLPLSLESASELARSLSPYSATRSQPSEQQVEEELDREFFDTIARDTQDVVNEELAAASAGISAIRLAEPLEAAAALHAGPSSQQHPHPPAQPSSISTVSAVPSPSRQPAEVLVPTVQGQVSFLCATPLGTGMQLELALASLLASCPRLLAQRSLVEMNAGPSGVAAMAAVRSARRAVATHWSLPHLQSLSRGLALNSARVVCERVRACHLNWGSDRHLQQAMRQAPSPPGCFELVVAAGLLEACLEQEVAGGARGGLGDVLRTARRLVQPCSSGGTALPSVRAMPSQSDPHPCQQQQCASEPAPSPPPGTLAMFVERVGVLAAAQQRRGLLQLAAGAGWGLVGSQPHEVAAWLAWSESATGSPNAQHFEVLVLLPR